MIRKSENEQVNDPLDKSCLLGPVLSSGLSDVHRKQPPSSYETITDHYGDNNL